MTKLSTKNLTLISLIAAAYVVPVFLFSDISFGVIQCRLSEVLTVLPLFSGVSVFGVTTGCFVFNLVGLFLGKTGVYDLFFGTAATLIAAIICYYIGRTKNRSLIYTLGMMPVVLVNGIIVGCELTYFLGLSENLFVNMGTVAVGEFIVCYGLGLPLIYALFRNNLYKKIFN